MLPLKKVCERKHLYFTPLGLNSVLVCLSFLQATLGNSAWTLVSSTPVSTFPRASANQAPPTATPANVDKITSASTVKTSKVFFSEGKQGEGFSCTPHVQLV